MKTAVPWFAAAVVATAALLLTGCGGGEPDANGSGAPPFEAVRSWTWTEAGPAGYRARGRLDLGDFVPLGSAPHVPGFASFDALKDGCLFDEETDALAPVATSVTNATARPASVSTRIESGPAGLFGTNNGWTELLLATSTADGVACENLFESYGERPSWHPTWHDVAPGATAEPAYAYLVIRDYLVPDSPKGSPALRLARSYLGVVARPGAWIASIDGPDPKPAFVMPASKIERAGFSLSGARPPCGILDGIRCVRSPDWRPRPFPR